MKIYNLKNFAHGLFMLALGLLNLQAIAAQFIPHNLP